MCTYNGARFLRGQLESISAQDKLPDELVICDDSSTDETVEIVEEFALQAGFPVRLEINESTLGATKNFEKAISLCQSQIIALADQDDVWHSRKLKCILTHFMDRPETVAVFSDADIIDEVSGRVQGRLWDTFFFGRKEQRRFANGHALNVLLKHPVVTGATMAFREKFRSVVLPMPEHHPHDYWMSILLSACGELRPIPEALIQYRRHANQQIGVGPGRLTLIERTKKVLKDQRQSYTREVECLRELCRQLEARNGDIPRREVTVKLIMEKILHRAARSKLPPSRLLRIPMVFREMANRGYWRYSEGGRSVARDIFL
jgi:hypothetical protein